MKSWQKMPQLLVAILDGAHAFHNKVTVPDTLKETWRHWQTQYKLIIYGIF